MIWSENYFSICMKNRTMEKQVKRNRNRNESQLYASSCYVLICCVFFLLCCVLLRFPSLHLLCFILNSFLVSLVRLLKPYCVLFCFVVSYFISLCFILSCLLLCLDSFYCLFLFSLLIPVLFSFFSNNKLFTQWCPVLVCLDFF